MNYFSSSDDEEETEPRRRKIFRPRINFHLQEPYFKERFRLRTDEVEYVLSRIEAMLQHATNLNRALSPDQQLLIALHWMGNGGQYHGVSDMHGIDKSTVCRVVKRVVNCIVNNLFHHIVKWPEDRSGIADQFFRMGGFPLVPINIHPDNRAEQRYNRCHRATRRIIECTFGILRERFPCVNYLRVAPEFAGMIVMAAATLHNIAKKDDFTWNFGENQMEEPPVHDVPRITPNERLNEFLALFE